MLTLLVPFAPPASASVELYGSGSTWSQIAVDQWRADVATPGYGNLSVNYEGVGSSAGRSQYYSGVNDFAVSEIPFSGRYCELGTCTNEIALASARPYAYLPIVAGGTSFMYNVSFGGQRINDLQFSPTTLAGIFTGTISFWDDPAIEADNGHRPLPHQPITPVIRSDGSGTTAQFTAFMASQTPGQWQAFCAKVGLNPCGPTSIYPGFSNAAVPAIAQQLSDGVAGYVAASYGSGSICYVEYGYAKERGFPVASILNKAGLYAQPSAGNVANALTGATINPDYTQNLTGVYTNPNPATYPISSYSYMIVPTTTASPFTTQKGAVLGAFINYFVCQGQQESAPLGYSPLPTNLVEDALAVEQKIPGAPPPPAVTPSTCNNPFVTGAFNATVAGAAAAAAAAKQAEAARAAAAAKAAASGSAGTAAAGANGAAAAAGGALSNAAAVADNAAADSGPGGTGSSGTNQVAITAVPTPIGSKSPPTWPYFVALVVALIIVVPPVIGIGRRRRRASAMP